METHSNSGIRDFGISGMDAFLKPLNLKLEQHRGALKEAGYEDIEDFDNFGSADLDVMRQALKE